MDEPCVGSGEEWTLESGDEQQASEQQQQQEEECSTSGGVPELGLHVRWSTPGGRSVVSHLPLKPLDSWERLEGLSKQLMQRAFPEGGRPEYLESGAYYRFTPAAEFLSTPAQAAGTQFRLLVSYEGWEYAVLQRELGQAAEAEEQPMLVTAIEFERTAMLGLGGLGLRVAFTAFPVVAVHKEFLDGVATRLRTDPTFKGIP